MAGAADVALAALFERLESANPVASVVNAALGRLDRLAEDVIEAFVPEIAFFLGDPFLKAEMRLDDEFRHEWRWLSWPRVSQALDGSELPRCAGARRDRTRLVPEARPTDGQRLAATCGESRRRRRSTATRRTDCRSGQS